MTFFESLHAKLPLPTRMLLGISAFIRTWWYAIAAVVILGRGGFIAMRRSDTGQGEARRLMLKLPVVGDLIQTAILERICRILVLDAQRRRRPAARRWPSPRTRRTTPSTTTALEQIREQMMEGQGLAEPIARTGLFPAAARQMFRVGEETGTLDQQLEVAAAYYNRELETKVKRFTSLFEPAIIIFMGVVVGFVAVALVSAMYGIYNQVKVG